MLDYFATEFPSNQQTDDSITYQLLKEESDRLVQEGLQSQKEADEGMYIQYYLVYLGLAFTFILENEDDEEQEEEEDEQKQEEDVDKQKQDDKEEEEDEDNKEEEEDEDDKEEDEDEDDKEEEEDEDDKEEEEDEEQSNEQSDEEGPKRKRRKRNETASNGKCIIF